MLDHHSLDRVLFLVVDFEGFTQKGQSIEPVEVGAMRIAPPGVVDPHFTFNRLIGPPAGMALPSFFSANTGIYPQHVADKPCAETVLAQLDRHLNDTPHAIVAHNAHVEARILLRYAHVCPNIAAMPFIDTLALARYLLPRLRRYGLDELAIHFGLPIPSDRHRALADVRLTCEIFRQLLNLWHEMHKDHSFYLLRRVAGIDTRPAASIQPSLFG